METVTVSRTVPAAPARVREAMADVGPFMRAAGFDEVTVEDGTVRLENAVGILTIELELAVVDRPDAALAYEQREGIFEEMETTYAVDPEGDGSLVTATTEFALDVSVVGPLFDATVVRRQRRRELEAQLEYLAGLE